MVRDPTEPDSPESDPTDGDPTGHDSTAPVDAIRQEARFGVQLLRRHGWRLLLVFTALLLPLWGFAELAGEIQARNTLAFDEPLLRGAQALASPGLDRTFLLISALGYGFGVLPVDLVLVVVLALKRRVRETVFAFFALGGSLLLNTLVKHLFARERPSLWEPLTPHFTYSFPSGHAMASATLAGVVLLLGWHTRWRWPLLVIALLLVVLVGFSRIYLGVHYPSDILAGWAAASTWTVAVYLVVFRIDRRPWHRA